MTKASLLEEVESCSTSVLSSRAGANRDGRNYVTGASQSVGRRRESPSTSAAPPGIPQPVQYTGLRFHGAGAGATVSRSAETSAPSGNRSCRTEQPVEVMIWLQHHGQTTTVPVADCRAAYLRGENDGSPRIRAMWS